MTTPIRVGIVGCGKIATADHIPGFNAVDDVQLTALCDPVAAHVDATRDAFPELASAVVFEQDKALFESGLVDAVALCTPNSYHYPQTLAACEAGLHVLCEKPIAATLEEATGMIEAARQADVILQINQSLYFSGLYQTLVSLARDGTIGEPFHVRCIRASGASPDKSWSPGADWFVQEKYQGGMLLDIGIHMADVMRMIMGEADSVAGLVDTRRPDIDVPDNINALFRYRNGGTGIMELSWTVPGGAGFLEVYGTGGRLRMGFGAEPIELWQDDVKEPDSDTDTEPAEDPHLSYPEPAEHDTSQQAFCDAIRGVKPSPVPGEYGRRALALCVAIEESSKAGTFVPVAQFA